MRKDLQFTLFGYDYWVMSKYTSSYQEMAEILKEVNRGVKHKVNQWEPIRMAPSVINMMKELVSLGILPAEMLEKPLGDVDSLEKYIESPDPEEELMVCKVSPVGKASFSFVLPRAEINFMLRRFNIDSYDMWKRNPGI